MSVQYNIYLVPHTYIGTLRVADCIVIRHVSRELYYLLFRRHPGLCIIHCAFQSSNDFFRVRRAKNRCTSYDDITSCE